MKRNYLFTLRVAADHMSKNKICKSCKRLLPENKEYFHKDKKYFHNVCKSCRNSLNIVIKNDGSMKICKSCNLSFLVNLENFHKSKREKDGLRSKCKNCRNKEKQTYKNNNKEKVAISDSIYRNREDIKVKKYYKRRDPEEKRKANEWRKEKYKNDLNFKIKHNLRTSFNRYLRKNKKTFDYIGITLEEFKIYIENKFTKEMTWENYGKTGWHIDHIIPLKSFEFHKYSGDELELIIYKAWNYKNLQPLWAKDNMSKGSKILNY